MARFIIANDIINRAAIEVGLPPSTDPVASTEDAYVQLTQLLTAAGQELLELNEWQGQVETFTITTQSTDTGTYDLPTDFST